MTIIIVLNLPSHKNILIADRGGYYMQHKKILIFIIDSGTKDNLLTFSKNVYEKALWKGQLLPVSEGHTVTSAFALMTGQLIYNEKFGYKMPIGDWVYRTNGEKYKQGKHGIVQLRRRCR